MSPNEKRLALLAGVIAAVWWWARPKAPAGLAVAPDCEVAGLPYGTSVPPWMTGQTNLPVIENR